MSRQLRAERYAKGASPTLITFITEKLAYLSFAEAMEFYEGWVEHLKPTELALLGCNDRFFLLTALLNRPDALHPWLYDRAREVEAEPDGYLDLWSRYHFKSSLITFAGSIQEILVDPEVRIAIFANTKEISGPFVSQIKDELEKNDELIKTYPDVLWRDAKERKRAGVEWAADAIVVKRRNNYKECTVEAHALNALPTGKHFPILLYDDLINERNVTNPEQIKKASHQLELSYPCGIGEHTRKRFVGTRYSYADAYGQMIEHEVAKPRIYPATHDGTLTGRPVLMSPEAWEKAKREMRSVISAQMLQNPLAGNENTFRVQWLKPYFLRPLAMNVYIMGDPSKGKSKTSDRTALAAVGIDSQGHKFLLDGYCHRMPLSERERRLNDLHKRWAQAPGVQMVSVGYERYGMQTDVEYFEEKMRERVREGEDGFAIEELNWTGDAAGESKAKRVERLEPDFRLGRFFVPGRVWHPVVRSDSNLAAAAFWSVDPETDEFSYTPASVLLQEERRAKAYGEGWRLFGPIVRKDEDGALYDLVRVFFEEYRFFPFSPRDDLIDAMSRIYDLKPVAAVPHEKVAEEVYADA